MAVVVGNDLCPFSNIDLFVIVEHSSFPLLNFLFTSVETFMPCYGQFNVVVEESDVPQLHLWLPHTHRVVVHPVRKPERCTEALGSMSGYSYQNYMTLYADRFVRPEAEYVMIVDSDAIFAMPVTCASLFDASHRPYHMSWNMTQSQPQFVAWCKLLNPTGRCERSSMSTFPFLIAVKDLSPMRTYFAEQLEHAISRMQSSPAEEQPNPLVVTQPYLRSVAVNNPLNGFSRSGHAAPPGKLDFEDSFIRYVHFSCPPPPNVTFHFHHEGHRCRYQAQGGFSNFVVMGEYSRTLSKDRYAQVYCPLISVVSSVDQFNEHLKQDTDSARCLNFVPNAVHYGWRTAYYLNATTRTRRGGIVNYFRTKTGECQLGSYSTKLSLSTIEAMTEIVRYGVCLKEFLSTSVRSPSCAQVDVQRLHEEVNIYGNDRYPDMDAVFKTFKPETSNTVCNQR